MITNNIYDAFENLLLGDCESIKIKISDDTNAVFTPQEVEGSIYLEFQTTFYSDDPSGIPNPIKNVKVISHYIEYDNEMMDESEIPNKINYILETFEDFLNQDFGMAPIGINKWKSSNCYQF